MRRNLHNHGLVSAITSSSAFQVGFPIVLVVVIAKLSGGGDPNRSLVSQSAPLIAAAAVTLVLGGSFNFLLLLAASFASLIQLGTYLLRTFPTLEKFRAAIILPSLFFLTSENGVQVLRAAQTLAGGGCQGGACCCCHK